MKFFIRESCPDGWEEELDCLVCTKDAPLSAVGTLVKNGMRYFSATAFCGDNACLKTALNRVGFNLVLGMNAGSQFEMIPTPCQRECKHQLIKGDNAFCKALTDVMRWGIVPLEPYTAFHTHFALFTRDAECPLFAQRINDRKAGHYAYYERTTHKGLRIIK